MLKNNTDVLCNVTHCCEYNKIMICTLCIWQTFRVKTEIVYQKGSAKAAMAKHEMWMQLTTTGAVQCSKIYLLFNFCSPLKYFQEIPKLLGVHRQ